MPPNDDSSKLSIFPQQPNDSVGMLGKCFAPSKYKMPLQDLVLTKPKLNFSEGELGEAAIFNHLDSCIASDLEPFTVNRLVKQGNQYASGY